MPLKRRKNPTPPASDGCPLNNCMSLLAGAWTPHVIWALTSGPRRFSELRSDLPGVSAKILSARLRGLQANAVVLRREMPTSPPTVEYELTDLGAELLPVIRTIADVGNRLYPRIAASREAA
jgi:DNA-binding HxlR family transcriptional regulator